MGFISKQQEIAMIVITWIPSILSIVGSSIIVYLSTRKTSKPSAYKRLVIGMSCMDLINTTTWILQPFLIPKSGGRVWAVGNGPSCQTMGFFTQFGAGVALYNASLAAYFCATIVYGVGDNWVEKRFEPVAHGVSILYPLITSLFVAGFRMSSEVQLGMMCWLNEYPHGCRDDPDVFCISQPLGWLFVGGPFLACLLIMTGCNILVFCKVRKGMRQSITSEFERNSRASSTFSFLPSSKNSNAAARRVRDVGIQSFLYVLASFNTIVWMIALRMVEGKAGGYVDRDMESDYYWLVIIVQLTYPSQGFFNAMIFIRPKYFRWRRRHPDDSRLRCLVATLSGATPETGRNRFTRSYVSTTVGTALKKEAPAAESDVALNDNAPKPNLAEEGEHDDDAIIGLNDNAPPRISSAARHVSFQSECSDDEVIANGSQFLSLKASARRLQLEIENAL